MKAQYNCTGYIFHKIIFTGEKELPSRTVVQKI